MILSWFSRMILAGCNLLDGVFGLLTLCLWCPNLSINFFRWLLTSTVMHPGSIWWTED